MMYQLETLSYRRGLSEALLYLGEKDRDIIVLDADVARSTGTIRFAERYPERYINLGISEQDLISTSAGVAIAGLKPVAVAFSIFLLRGWEQIRNTICRDKLNVKLVGTHSGLSPHMDGSSHQCLEDIAVMRCIPNITVISPADASATYALTVNAVEEHYGPLYLRLGRDNAIRVYDWDIDLKVGGVNVLVDGYDATLIACGPMVGICLEVEKLLRKSGLKVGVVDFYTIKPVEENVVIKAAKDTGLVVTVEEHNIIGGLGSAISEVVCESYPVPVVKVGVKDSYGSSSRNYFDLLDRYNLTPQHIAGKVEEAFYNVKTCK